MSTAKQKIFTLAGTAVAANFCGRVQNMMMPLISMCESRMCNLRQAVNGICAGKFTSCHLSIAELMNKKPEITPAAAAAVTKKEAPQM